jgi:hypothetical protein
VLKKDLTGPTLLEMPGKATDQELAAGEEALTRWMRRHSSQPRRLRTVSNQAHLLLGIAARRGALLSAVRMFDG